MELTFNTLIKIKPRMNVLFKIYEENFINFNLT